MSEQKNTQWVEELKVYPPIFASNNKNNHSDASVLIVLREHEGRLQVMLTQRSENLRHHANEWSLPGGKTETGENNFDTALRESDEEVGLKSHHIERIGQLENFKSKNELDVSVCICALTSAHYIAKLNPEEVQKMIWFDLNYICNKPDRTHRFERFGQTILIPFYDVLEPSLWGLTAMILQSFIKTITPYINVMPRVQTLLSNSCL